MRSVFMSNTDRRLFIPCMLKGLHLVEAIEPGPFDWSKVVDESYLPPDLRTKVH